MYKIKLMIVLVLSCTFLYSCTSDISSIHDESEELKIAESSLAERFNPLTDYKKYGKQMDDFAEDVANGFINKDYEMIKQNFCQRSLDTYDLDTDINNVFEKIGSDILSYGEINHTFGGKTFGGGNVSRLTGSVEIDDVKTEDNSYVIHINCVMKYDDDNSEIGIQNINITPSDWKAREDPEHEYFWDIGEVYDSWNW
ncbi:DUF5104 domain-containing protein [Ruminococcus albus]|uniref:DUF5104 domain-containing protein n=1 Tax=Ruminococcus albus (strain ATCC 27210 / DSM 20455 / JCM 14654 / NCDO 2250 / 7) TaxID=697329 RepID=E6UI36_RUMA7|nr:DUF5104 domain-containing protein [Ruminococcus albus]ADU21289.1 hypothetical protein Rumal_0751 [Ruminococcus albus 7 = DSM 20455]